MHGEDELVAQKRHHVRPTSVGVSPRSETVSLRMAYALTSETSHAGHADDSQALSRPRFLKSSMCAEHVMPVPPARRSRLEHCFRSSLSFSVILIHAFSPSHLLLQDRYLSSISRAASGPSCHVSIAALAESETPIAG